MPALLELLDQYFFADVPGTQARNALIRGWEQISGMTWTELYVQATEDALAEELPHLSAYSGYNTVIPSHQDLEQALTADLGEPGNALRARDLSSGAYLTELARTMQVQRLILINQQNLFTDEYRQILLNLFDFAHTRFKRVISDHPDDFAAALNRTTQHDSILIASIATFLTRQFGITLAALPTTPPPPTQPMPIPEETFVLPTPSAQEVMTVSENSADANELPPTIPPPLEPAAQPELMLNSPGESQAGRPAQNRLRVLLATPADVSGERALLTQLIQEISARARTRFGLDLELINPSETELAGAKSAVELADIFIGAVWLHFGASSIESNSDTGATYFAGTESDFALALEQAGGRSGGWLRTVIYRSIRPPLDLLHLNVAEYTRVQQFFERAGAFAGEDFIRVYNDSNDLLADAHARLEAWIYNYAIDLANALTEYGKTGALAGQTYDALADLEQAATLYRELDRPTQELNIRLQVATLYRQINQPVQAAAALDAALRLANLTEDNDAIAVTLHQRGLLTADARDWRDALHTFQQARSHLKPDAAIYRAILADEISAHEQLGDAAAQADDPLHARDAYRDALALAQEIDDTPRASILWQKLGALAETRGEWSDALEAYHQAAVNLDANAPADARIALTDSQANAQLQIAIGARDAGDTANAERAYRAALDLNEQGSRSRARRVEIFASLGALAAGSALWDQAIESNNLALEQLTTAEDAPLRETLLREQALAYQNRGDAQFAQNLYAAAGEAYREAFALYQELDARTEQGAMLNQLGKVSLAQERWQEANTYFTQALGRLNAPEAESIRADAQFAQATALTRLGDAHQSTQEWGQAEIAYLQARGNLEQLGMGYETGALLTQLGVVTAAQGRPQEAIAFFEQARARLHSPEQSETRAHATRLEANTLRQIADLRRGAGDFAQAEAAYRQQLDLAQEIQDAALESDALHHLGLVSADREQWDDAIEYYDSALAHADASVPPETRLLIQRHQLLAYEKLGERERAAHQFPQAEMAYRSALTYAQALNETEREADFLYLLGLLSIEQENWDEALLDLRRALGIYNLMPSAPHKPQVIWNIGRAQRGSKRKQMEIAFAHAAQLETEQDFAGAIPVLGAAAQFAQELGDAKQEGIAYEQLGRIASAQADWDAALGYYAQAAAKLSPDESERRSAITRAQVHALQQRSANARQAQAWDRADQDLTLALELNATLDDRVVESDLLHARGLLAAEQARWNDAIALYSDALNALDETDTKRAAIEISQANAYQALGDSERDAQNWEGAESAYQQSLALHGASASPQIRAPLFAALGDVLSRQARWGEAVEFYTQARALSADFDAAQLQTLDANLERAQLAHTRAQQADAEMRGDSARTVRELDTAHAEYLTAIALAAELQDRSALADLYAKLGFVETEQEDFENALAHYRTAAGMYDPAEHAAQRKLVMELQAQSLQELGNRAGKAGGWNRALDSYQQAIALLDAPEQAEQRQDAIRLAAVTLQNLGDQAQANQAWEHALDLYRRSAGMFGLLGQDDAQRTALARQGTMLSILARQARSDGAYDTAGARFAQAAELLSEARDVTALNLLQRERVGVFTEIGDASAARLDWQAATDAYQQGYTLAQEVGDRNGQADLLFRLGQVQARQSQWQPALSYFDGALSLADSEQWSELRAQILEHQQHAFRALANEQRLNAEWDDAESNYHRALGAALERSDRANAGELYFVLGTLAADQNAWDKALGNYALALENIEPAYRDDVKTYQALAFQNWGDAQRAAGQFDAAASAYASALQAADTLHDDERAANVLYRTGLLHATLGHWEQALEFYNQAAARAVGDDAALRVTLGNDKTLAERALARAQLDTQLAHAGNAQETAQWDDAATAYRASLKLAHELDDAPTQERAAQALVNIFAAKAATLQQMELWDEAQDAYRESLALAREFHFENQVKTQQNNLMALGFARVQMLRDSDDAAAAEQAAQASLALAQEFGDANKQADMLYTLGLLAAQQGHWSDAKNYFEQARPLLVSAERSDSLLNVDHELAVVNDILRRQAMQDESLSAAETAAAASDFAQAETLYRRALDLARGLGRPTVVAGIGAALVKLASDKAHAAHQTGSLQDTERAYRQAIAAAQEFGDTETLRAQQQELIAAATEHANALRAQQDWDGSALAYRHALALAQEFGDTPAERARQQDLIALAQEQTAAYHANQDFANAERAAQNTFALAQEFGDAHAQADALFALGTFATEQLAWEAAKSYYEQARPLYAAQDRDDELARLDADLAAATDILNRQAQLEQGLLNAQTAGEAGEFAEAESAYRTSLDLARGLGKTAVVAGIGTALVKLASDKAHAARQTASPQETEQAYRHAIAAAQEFADSASAHARQQDLLTFAREQTATLRASNNLEAAQNAAAQYLELAKEFDDTHAQSDAYFAMGAIAADEHQWETALAHYQSSIALLIEPESAGRVAEIGAEIERVTRAWKTEQRDQLRAQGDAARQSENWQVAETSYENSLALSEELGDTEAQGEIQLARAQAAAAQNLWTRAAALYATAIGCFGLSASDTRYAELTRQKMAAWQAAGNAAAQAQDWSAALTDYAEALSDAKQLDDRVETVLMLRQLGDIAVAQNDLHGALGYYDAVLQEIGTETESQRSEILAAQGSVWHQLGDAEMEAHHLPEAQMAYERASDVYTALDHPADRATVLHSLGLIYGARQDWTRALDAHQTAYNLIHDLDIPQVHAEILESLGDTHLQLDHPEAARAKYAQALELTRTQPQRQARLHTALGDIGMAQEHWQDAISHLTAATALYQAEADSAQVKTCQDKTATCYSQLGDVNYGEGNWQDADAAYVNALALDSATGRTDRDAELWYRLARTDAAQEQYAEAIEHYEAALAALDDNQVQLRDRILGQLAFTLQQLGKQLLAQGEWANAQPLLERALKMAIASDNFDQAADVSLALGHTLTAQGKYADAAHSYRSALAFDQRDGSALRAHEINQALANCLLENARVDLDNAQAESAQEHLVDALPYAERANNPLLLGQVMEALGDSVANTNPTQAVEYHAQAARQYAAVEAMELWRGVAARQAGLLVAIAASQIENENFADAENSYRRALLLQQASDDTTALGETYLGLGRALAAQAQWTDASDAFDHAHAHWQDDRASRHTLLTLHANVLEHIGDDAAAARNWANAGAAYQRAAEMQDTLEARTASGAIWHKLAQIAAAQELWDTAAEANTQALARLDGTDAPQIRSAVLSQQAQILGHIGQAQQRAGELALASETYRGALVIAQEQGNLATIAELYALLGSLAEAQADWSTADAEYHHALDVYHEMELPLEQANTWARLGDMHRRAEQYTDATDAYQAARTLYHENNMPLLEGNMLHRLGLVRADVQDWDGALDWYDHALTLYNAHNARSAKIEIYQSMEVAVRRAKRHAAQLATLEGDALMDAGDMLGAEKAYREALALYAEAQEHVLQAQMQNQLGVTLEAQGRYDDALEQYQAARLGFQEQEIPAAEIGVLANIGDVERQRAHWLEAETAYRHALALNQDQEDPLRAAELYTSLGHVRRAQDDWEGAIDNYQDALRMLQDAEQDTTEAELNLANARRGARLQEQANCEQALALARENDNLAEEGELLNTLGLMAAENQEWDKALSYYRAAVQVFEQLEREADNDEVWRTAQGTVLNNIGDASQALGAWREAEDAYARALDFARELRDDESEAVLLANLGNAAQQLREYPRALDLNVQALDKYTALGETTAQPELLERIGNLQLQLEQRDAAERTFQQALDAAQAAQDSERAARLLMQLGSLAEGRDDDREALAYDARALEIAQMLGQAQEEKALHFRMGKLYARSGDWTRAQAAYESAYALALEQGDKPLQSKLAVQMGISAAQLGDWRKALEHQHAALALSDPDEHPRARAEIYQRIGDAHAALNEPREAETAYLAALQILERDNVAATDSSALWRQLAELAKQQSHWQDATVYYARARAALPAETSAETAIELAIQQGDAALRIPDRDMTQTCYDEAFEWAQTHIDRAQLGVVYERLGTLAQSRREWDEALAQLQEAIEIQRELKQPLGEARILNDIARLKLEMQNASEADLFAQAALSIAQAFGSASETSRSLYVRALAALETQEFDLGERFLSQAIATDPNNVPAQLQLGNTLLAMGRAKEAGLQAEAGLGQSAEWELGARTQLTIVALNSDDTRAFRQHLKHTRARLSADAEQRRVSNDFIRSVELIVEALEGNAENALGELDRMRSAPALPTTLDAAQFARTGLLALSKSPRRFKGKPALVTYFALPKMRSRKNARRRSSSDGVETDEQSGSAETE